GPVFGACEGRRKDRPLSRWRRRQGRRLGGRLGQGGTYGRQRRTESNRQSFAHDIGPIDKRGPVARKRGRQRWNYRREAGPNFPFVRERPIARKEGAERTPPSPSPRIIRGGEGSCKQARV